MRKAARRARCRRVHSVHWGTWKGHLKAVAYLPEAGSLILGRFTSHCRWRQKEVAKIVHCGGKLSFIKSRTATREGGLKFYCEAEGFLRHNSELSAEGL